MKAIANVSLAALVAGSAWGQAGFEVASIRPNRSGGARGSVEFLVGGERLTATNVSIGQLILVAYGVTPLQVSMNDAASERSAVSLDALTGAGYGAQERADRPAHF